jgi:Nucleoside 2-deoxyribosyltransferase
VLLPTVARYVDVLDPWSVDIDQITATPTKQRGPLWVDLGERHYCTILMADLLVALLDQEPPDNGTVCEVAWAAAHGIPVIGYRADARTGGEEGLPYNLMIAAAIQWSGGVAVSSLAGLEVELADRADRCPRLDGLSAGDRAAE